jgi:hypothetical protein
MGSSLIWRLLGQLTQPMLAFEMVILNAMTEPSRILSLVFLKELQAIASQKPFKIPLLMLAFGIEPASEWMLLSTIV